MLAAQLASYMTISITIQHHEMNTFPLSQTPKQLSSFRAHDRHRILQPSSGSSKLIGSAQPKARCECLVIDL
jgi:hypothetical protein